MMLRVFVSVLSGSAIAFFAGNSTAQNLPLPAPKMEAPVSAPLTAQERLDAIRLALVEASLQTPTKVFSTSWFDSNNSLREASSFKNNMQVESLRVMAYGRDESGQPKAKLHFEDAKTPVNQQAEKICEKKLKTGLKHLMGVELWMDASSPMALRSSVLELMSEHWVNDKQHGTATAWRMSRNDAEPSMSKNITTYERELTSSKPEVMPWQARLAVKTELLNSKGQTGLFSFKSPSMLVTLLLQVTPRDGQKGLLQKSTTLKLAMDSEAWKQPQLKPDSYLALSEQFQAWQNDLSQLVACEPVTPSVTAVRTDTIVINAGSESGIRKGDEWLLADPRQFPSQLMDKNGASQTLLAQVENVSPYQAELTILAGPAQSVQKNWRAWPTETLVKEPANPPSGNGFFKR
jgi:hypothetical protein